MRKVDPISLHHDAKERQNYVDRPPITLNLWLKDMNVAQLRPLQSYQELPNQSVALVHSAAESVDVQLVNIRRTLLLIYRQNLDLKAESSKT